MTLLTLKRQFINDDDGNPIGVILPWDEYTRIEKFLEYPVVQSAEAEKITQMKQAAKDPLFIADLEEAMSAFAHIDTEWWEAE